MKILIIEEYEGMVQVFRRLLRNIPDIETAWEARTGLEAVVAVESFKPDIILMSRPPSWRQGIRIWKEYKRRVPECKLLALMVPENSRQAKQGKALGIAFLAKEETVRSLVPTIRSLSDSSTLERCAQ